MKEPIYDQDFFGRKRSFVRASKGMSALYPAALAQTTAVAHHLATHHGGIFCGQTLLGLGHLNVEAKEASQVIQHSKSTAHLTGDV